MIGQTVKVSWHDAEMHFELDAKDIENIKLPEVHTYGVIISDTESFLVIAAEQLLSSYRSVTIIPKSLIFNMTPMGEVRIR
jgi:hypothetical protein